MLGRGLKNELCFAESVDRTSGICNSSRSYSCVDLAYGSLRAISRGLIGGNVIMSKNDRHSKITRHITS